MNLTIHIDSNKKRVQAINVLSELPEDGSHEIEIKEYSPSRSMRQNKLYWLWVTEVANHMGIGKDEMHFAFKEKYAVPIFIRDDEGYAEMVDAVKDVRRQNMNKQAESMKKKIVDLTSTTDFTVKQMTEMLNSIENYASEIGATITFPPDIYETAMGIKR